MRLPPVILALSALLLTSVPALAQCPVGYSDMGGGACRPALKPEFFYGALDASIPPNFYPICGAGRVPVTGDGSYSWSTMSSSGVPKSSNSNTVGYQQYRYLKTAGGPVYGYSDLDRCVCIGKTIPETPQVATYGYLGPLSGSQRVLPDTFDVINSQTSLNQARYGMVAIANDNAADGRLGAWYQVGMSKCGCPNFNEIPEQVDPTAPATDPIGVRCVPAVASGPNRVLSGFNAATHDAGAASIVMNRTNEPILQGTTQLVTKIVLPRALADQTNVSTYTRRIWTCSQPYRLNPSTGSCDYRPEMNACDEGDSLSGVPASEMSPYIAGSSKIEAFRNAINKKLGACLNEFGSLGSTVKFDCIENTLTPFANFNDLWVSTDPAADGGQPAAFLLRNPAGRPMTGFFKVSGERCDEFSEFAGDVQPGRLEKSGSNWTFNPTGSLILRPPGGLSGVDFLVNKITAEGKRIPQTPAEKLRCPILVRAALLATCPKNPVLPAAQRTLEVRDAGGVLVQRRCSVASTIAVHFKVEQVFEIADSMPMKTFDTIVEGNQVNALSVSQLTAAKYGSACPPGTTNQDGLCVY